MNTVLTVFTRARNNSLTTCLLVPWIKSASIYFILQGVINLPLVAHLCKENWKYLTVSLLYSQQPNCGRSTSGGSICARRRLRIWNRKRVRRKCFGSVWTRNCDHHQLSSRRTWYVLELFSPTLHTSILSFTSAWCIDPTPLFGSTENAGPEMGDQKDEHLKMQDLKIQDQISAPENAGPKKQERNM